MKYGTGRRWYQREAFKFLVLGLSFVLIFSVTYLLNQRFLERAAATEKILVARRDVLPSQALGKGDILLAPRPVLGLAGQEITDVEAFFEDGPWFAGTLGIGRGDVILKSRLYQEQIGDQDVLELMRERGKRMVAIETDLTRSCARHLRPGSIVDAIVYLSRRDAYGQEQYEIIGPEEDPFLSQLLVMEQKNSSGNSLETTVDDSLLGKDQLPAVVTLVLDEGETEQAKALIRYNEIGRIYLSPMGRDKDWQEDFDALG